MRALRDCAWLTVAGPRAAARGPPQEGARRAVPRVVIAAGGTAGHVVPALAVADALRASGADVSFLGTREGAEGRLVPAGGYELDCVRARGIERRSPLKALRAGALAAPATVMARSAIRERHADAL